MRRAILCVFLLAACGKAETLPEPASAPRYAGEIAVASSVSASGVAAARGGVYAGEVLSASSGY